jgi:hypothetical protein
MIGVYLEGGLCNRLFQIAFGYAFAKKHGLKFKIEGWKVHTHHSTQIYEWLIERFMALPNYERVDKQNNYHEQFKELYENYSDFCEPTINRDVNVFMRGFFQNEKYFIEYRDEILELFKEPEQITVLIENSKYMQYLEHAYFLHIRLGDYVNCKKHWIDLEKYYINALSHIDNDAAIFIFSNFPNEIHKHYKSLLPHLQRRNIIIVDDTDEVFNLYLMSRCKKGGICANSSFSWWGSWLNKNEDKKVFMPSKWINEMPSNGYPSYATVLDV